MKVQKNGYLSTWQAAEQYLNQNPKPGQIRTQEGLSFQDILQTKQPDGEVKFSKHAVQRLSNRKIELTSGQMERLQEGTARAQEKGIKESLVLVDQLAFIVNIPNNTVVTAMDRQDAAENIFTNIDGAVII